MQTLVISSPFSIIPVNVAPSIIVYVIPLIVPDSPTIAQSLAFIVTPFASRYTGLVSSTGFVLSSLESELQANTKRLMAKRVNHCFQ